MKPDLDGARTGNQLANERPLCAALIGAVTMSWSSLEQTMALCFVMFALGHGQWSGPEHGTLTEAFDAIESMRQKCEVVLVAAKRSLSDELVERLRSILGRVGKAATQRNRIVHGRWMVSEKYPDALIHVRRFGDIEGAKLYDPRRFTEVIEQIDNAHEALDQFWREEASAELKALARRHLDSMKFVADALAVDALKSDVSSSP